MKRVKWGKRKVYAIDLDGVLCEYEDGWDDVSIINKKPILENIKKVERLFNERNIIVIYTSRGEELRASTEAWMKKHGIKYHFLVMNKLFFDYYVDEKDKFVSIDEL